MMQRKCLKLKVRAGIKRECIHELLVAPRRMLLLKFEFMKLLLVVVNR